MSIEKFPLVFAERAARRGAHIKRLAWKQTPEAPRLLLNAEAGSKWRSLYPDGLTGFYKLTPEDAKAGDWVIVLPKDKSLAQAICERLMLKREQTAPW